MKYTDFNKGKYTGDSGRILGHILNPDASLRVLEILGTKEPLVELYWSQSRGEFPDNFVFTKDESLISVGKVGKAIRSLSADHNRPHLLGLILPKGYRYERLANGQSPDGNGGPVPGQLSSEDSQSQR